MLEPLQLRAEICGVSELRIITVGRNGGASDGDAAAGERLPVGILYNNGVGAIRNAKVGYKPIEAQGVALPGGFPVWSPGGGVAFKVVGSKVSAAININAVVAHRGDAAHEYHRVEVYALIKDRAAKLRYRAWDGDLGERAAAVEGSVAYAVKA